VRRLVNQRLSGRSSIVPHCTGHDLIGKQEKAALGPGQPYYKLF